MTEINSKYWTCEKYCTLIMFQWSQPKSKINLIKKSRFHNYCHPMFRASTSGKENSMESFAVMLGMVKEHVWRNFGPFLDADPCKILRIPDTRPHSNQKAQLNWRGQFISANPWMWKARFQISPNVLVCAPDNRGKRCILMFVLVCSCYHNEWIPILP